VRLTKTARFSGLARSSTFKIALVYVVLFSSSIFGLLAYVYWSTTSYLRENLDRAVVAERTVLMRAYDTGGRRGLMALIDKRAKDERLAGWVYELADAAFAPVAGNLAGWPSKARAAMDADAAAGWRRFADFEAPAEAAQQYSLRATYRTLSNGDHLLVGREVAGLDGFAATTATALAVAAGLFLVLAAAAGISTARRSVTRIEAINATSREIMRAGLGRRIPLRGTGDEWDELATNLNSMLARIEQLVETNRQVSDNIAHDLRTPLTRMRARLERAAAQPPAATGYQTLVHDMIGEMDGVLQTFSSLLRISRIEATDHSAAFPQVDLNNLTAEVIELFDAAAEENSVRLIFSGSERLPINGDRDVLFDAISNLVDNAIRHGGRGGEVQVAVGHTGDGPTLSIADRGPGVPPGERQQVFKRFYRLEHSRNSPGNGLGLSLVAAVADLHGARIELTDNAPGLKVELHFPPVNDVAVPWKQKTEAESGSSV
jgi:signal transduction histidine kinase